MQKWLAEINYRDGSVARFPFTDFDDLIRWLSAGPPRAWSAGAKTEHDWGVVANIVITPD